MGDQSVGSTEYNNECHEEDEEEDGDSDVVVVVVVLAVVILVVLLVVVALPVRVQDEGIVLVRSTRIITGAACGYMRGISN